MKSANSVTVLQLAETTDTPANPRFLAQGTPFESIQPKVAATPRPVYDSA